MRLAAFLFSLSVLTKTRFFDENFYEIRFVLDDRSFALLGKCCGSVHV